VGPDPITEDDVIDAAVAQHVNDAEMPFSFGPYADKTKAQTADAVNLVRVSGAVGRALKGSTHWTPLLPTTAETHLPTAGGQC
jgi:hypothetical protein